MWAYGWGSRKHRGLNVWVLHLLERGPMNGAEIMDQMDRMTLGWWRPSPGSIYPLLEQLEKDKLVEKLPDGRYGLTDQARSGPDWFGGMGFPRMNGPRDPSEAAREIETYVRYLEDLSRAEPGRLAPLAGILQEVAERLGRLAGTGQPLPSTPR